MRTRVASTLHRGEVILRLTPGEALLTYGVLKGYAKARAERGKPTVVTSRVVDKLDAILGPVER